MKEENLTTPTSNDTYDALLQQIASLAAQAQQRAVQAVNNALVELNWNIGRHIVEFEQQGNTRAAYGERLIPKLSRDLTIRLGKGYSRSNLANMRLLYLRFPIFQTLSGKLTWSHWIEIMEANLFVAKYQLYLPQVEDLKQLVMDELNKINTE